MDIKNYIASGLLELYVSGALTEQEAQEVCLLSEQYPAVKVEIEAIESTMMAYAALFVGEKQLPSLKLSDLEEAKAAQASHSEGIVKKVNWRLWTVAASVFLLLSLFLNFFFFNQWQDSRAYIATLTQENSLMAQESGRFQTHYQETLAILGDTAYIRIPMKSANKTLAPSALAHVFWNPQSESIFLQVRKLPEIDEQQSQYQLWAIKDGKPISAGVFDLSEDLQRQAVNIGGAVQAFAVTLEPKGGSETPTLDKMYVMGQLSS